MAQHKKDVQEVSKVFSYLNRKSKKNANIEFDYIHLFKEVQKRTSDEIQYINLIFPEYTPHDEKYHISNCFHIADNLLDDGIISNLNKTELFLLAICLYAHDWGMAISPKQKTYILDHTVIDPNEAKWLLVDERERFLQFLKDEGIGIPSDNNFKDLPLHHFQKYIRQTHAERSGKRIFELLIELEPNYGSGVGEVAQNICLGHTLEFEQLEDLKNYPLQSSLLRETVNVRALTIYVRLVDLFDLGEDRTPYIIWKFVSPIDSTSKMEWAKHRALRPISFPQNEGIRTILVNGSTDSPEVYASLEDLRRACEEQLRKSNDLLSRMNILKYNLEVRHIDWIVKPNGFEPINIRFEFDRSEMFEILSSEIYQNDPLVFLRELLQNSIDAIRLRRELLMKSQGLDVQNLGKIEVNIEHHSDGDSTIVWTDDGIGMDEYIIENFFSVAGKSYYRSSDFEKLGLKIDPISKYGIGILSCFQVANKIEISTCKDPYLAPESKLLEISIPDISRQFRIEKKKRIAGTKVGTKIKIFVCGSKIRKKNRDFSRLEVTPYLNMIAGFVEFPIFITENQEKNVIIHPHMDLFRFKKFLDDGWNISQHNSSLKFSDVFFPPDLENAEKYYSLKKWDIKIDLQVEGYEGEIFFFIPKLENCQFVHDFSTGISGVKVINEDGKDDVIRWYLAYSDGPNFDDKEKYETFAVFNQGILLAKTELPWSLQGHVTSQVNPRIKATINLIGKNSSIIDISRQKPSREYTTWFDPISQAIVKKIFEEENILYSNLNPNQKLLKIGQL